MKVKNVAHLGAKLNLSSRHALLVLMAIALAARLAYLPVNPYPADQSTTQGEMARNIIHHGRWFYLDGRANALIDDLRERDHRPIDPAEVDFRRVDAHPQWQRQILEVVGPGLVLAGLWEITGSERYVYGEIVQILLDTLIVLLVYRISMHLFKRPRAALLAAALYAIYPPIARQASIYNPDIWAVDLTVAIVACHLQAMHSPARRWLVLCGVTLGVGTFFRPNLLLLPPAIALASVPWAGWRRPLAGAAMITAIAAVLLIPWTIYNYVDFHRFIPTRIGTGATLWQGLGEIHNDFGAYNNDAVTYEQVHREHPGLVLGTPAYDDYLRGKAVHAIEGHPLFYAKVLAKRILLSTAGMYDSAWMYHGGESPLRYRQLTGRGLLSYVVNRPIDLLQSVFQPALFMLAMLALAVTWRGRNREHALLLAVALATFLPYWILHLEARYVYPVSFIYFIWIGMAADMVLLRRSSRRARTAVPGLLAQPRHSVGAGVRSQG